MLPAKRASERRSQQEYFEDLLLNPLPVSKIPVRYSVSFLNHIFIPDLHAVWRRLLHQWDITLDGRVHVTPQGAYRPFFLSVCHAEPNWPRLRLFRTRKKGHELSQSTIAIIGCEYCITIGFRSGVTTLTPSTSLEVTIRGYRSYRHCLAEGT